MGIKAWWHRWEPEHQETLGGILLILLIWLGAVWCQTGGHNKLQDDLLKDGYNIRTDSSKPFGDGHYTIQIWQDGQWNDVLRCGE